MESVLLKVGRYEYLNGSAFPTMTFSDSDATEENDMCNNQKSSVPRKKRNRLHDGDDVLDAGVDEKMQFVTDDSVTFLVSSSSQDGYISVVRGKLPDITSHPVRRKKADAGSNIKRLYAHIPNNTKKYKKVFTFAGKRQNNRKSMPSNKNQINKKGKNDNHEKKKSDNSVGSSGGSFLVTIKHVEIDIPDIYNNPDADVQSQQGAHPSHVKNNSTFCEEALSNYDMLPPTPVFQDHTDSDGSEAILPPPPVIADECSNYPADLPPTPAFETASDTYSPTPPPPNDDTLFKCELCDKTFQYKTQLGAHFLNKHSGVKAIKCEICDKRFSHYTNLHRHKFKVHKIRVAKKKQFFHKAVVRKSPKPETPRKQHPSTKKKSQSCDEDPFGCNHCGKAFPTFDKLLIHASKVHPTPKKFKCKKCYKGFSHERTLAKHIGANH